MNVNIPDFSQTRILILGDVMMDQYVWGSVNRISPEAPIPVVHIQDRSARLGGAGNVAANLAGLGCRTSLIGIIGKDHSGTQLADLLLKQGIDNACLVVPGLHTVTKTRIMGSAQQIVRLDDEQPDSVNEPIREKIFDRFRQHISEAKAVIISDYGKGLLDETLIKKSLALCRKRNVPVFVDPKREEWQPYAGATCITPNSKEFALACRQVRLNKHSMDDAAQFVLESYDFEHLLVTRGSEGMTLWDNQGGTFSIPSRAREVFDVSGAGDTVIAVLAAAFSTGLSMPQAMDLANFGAGEVVGRVGTYAITRADLVQAAATASGSSTALCTLSQARSLMQHWRMLGQTVVFTNGCFDILHPGHVSLLQRARQLGHRLVIGLNTDASIKRIKGPSRPIIEQEDRAAILSALNCVDAVVLFDDDTPINLIDALKPDILVKGGDYTPATVVGAELISDWGGRVEILELAGEKSTTAIVEKIRHGGKENGIGTPLNHHSSN